MKIDPTKIDPISGKSIGPNRHELHSGLTAAGWNTCGFIMLVPIIIVACWLFWKYMLN